MPEDCQVGFHFLDIEITDTIADDIADLMFRLDATTEVDKGRTAPLEQKVPEYQDLVPPDMTEDFSFLL